MVILIKISRLDGCALQRCSSLKKNRFFFFLFCVIDDASENGQRDCKLLQTVGSLWNRYRLGHLWVPEMVLNVQSKLVYFFNK